MNSQSAGSQPPPGAPTLRPEQPGDEAFLLDAFASTRQEELALTNWDTPTRAAFVASQFQAMRAGYASMFPNGEFSVILLAGKPIGRMVVDRNQGEIHVVDMILLPEFCSRGIGRRLIDELTAEAVSGRKIITLHVLKMNRAIRFYARLGFVKTGDAGPYDKMEWHPPAISA
jgi:ribosomal protein S18 acetylase RimI-like enzyme